MLRMLISRAAQAITLMFVMSLLVYIAVFSVGDPVDIMTSGQMTPQQIEELKRQLGLDLPVWQQYVLFLKNLAAGDIGTSFVFGKSAMVVVLERLPATMELAFLAILIALAVGIPVGVAAGLRQNSWLDRAAMSISSLFFSVPSFWAGIILVLVFAVELRWLPTNGRGPTIDVLGWPISILTPTGLKYALLPAINLALPVLALILRLTRAGVIEHAKLDYIKFARAKGLSRSRIIVVHLMRNVLIPIITVTGLQFGTLLGFAVITETVFAWPGVGKLIVDSIVNLDRPVIVAHLLIVVMIFTVINFLIDVTYMVVDPRTRVERDLA